MVVFTPCHGARVLFPPDQAVPEQALRVVCPRDGVERRLELVADQAVEGGFVRRLGRPGAAAVTALRTDSGLAVVLACAACDGTPAGCWPGDSTSKLLWP
ncbi:MAG: hypothetical protein ACRDZ4_17965 [Egibacteraceae bacterium]